MNCTKTKILLRTMTGTLLTAVAFVMLFPVYASAYFEPGTGSVVLQLLLGGIAGIAVAIKLYWKKIITRFKSPKE